MSGALGRGLNQDVASLFDAVADLAPSGREAYYRQHGVSPNVRAEVESLVSFDQQSDALLVEAVAAGASHAASILQRELLPDRCGPFQPERLLGQAAWAQSGSRSVSMAKLTSM